MSSALLRKQEPRVIKDITRDPGLPLSLEHLNCDALAFTLARP